MRPLSGKSVVVIGASGGIGGATARLLAERQADVHALARRTCTGPFAFHRVDISDRDAAARVMREVGESSGIDAVVAAAAQQLTARRLAELTPDSWDQLISVNLSGTFYCIHAALPYLRRARGDVVLISSVSALWPDWTGPAYQASKAGLMALARAANFEERGQGVRFSTVMPGLVDTPFIDKRPERVPAEILAKALRPEAVAEICVFLLGLDRGVHIPELTILPNDIQALGASS